MRTIETTINLKKQHNIMAKYLNQLRAKNIVLVPGNKVERVCNEAERAGIIALGGAMVKTPKGVYQWLYREAA